jgi:FkbM family methyltransferase
MDCSDSKGVEVQYMGRALHFKGTKDQDEVLELMQKTKSLYEVEVLESIQHRLKLAPREGLFVDVGAFIGTHSLYFALFCGAHQVIAYEADPHTFAALKSNVRTNGVEAIVTCINKALGAQEGMGSVVRWDQSNTSANYVRFSSANNRDQVEVVRLDDEVSARNAAPVQLIKIDVEGAEVTVLKGAREVIDRSRPLLCVEMLTATHVCQVLWLLHSRRYAILDCVGYVPTYILDDCRESSWLRRHGADVLWVIRAGIPARFSRTRWYLKRLARILLEAA